MSTSAPAVPAAPGQGAPATPEAQPPAGGQGQGGQGVQPSGSGFNWGLFPDVPEGQRELLQPHLTNVLGHVTRMEQQYAPYKGLTDLVQPDQVQNLTQFLQNYSQDPLATWLGLAQSLTDEGVIKNPNFSLEQLQQLVAEQEQAPVAGAEDMPPWAQSMAQQLQTMSQAEEQRQQAEQQRQAEAEAAQQEQMLEQAKGTIKEQLKAAGITEGLVTDEQMVAALIAHNGDLNQAVASFTGLRDGFLKGFTDANGAGPKPPTVNGETPQAPKGGLRQKSGDGFREASLGAQQMLSQAAAASG